MSAALAALRAHSLHRSVFLRATNNKCLLRPWLPRHADAGEPRRRNFTTPTPGHHPEKPASSPTKKAVASSVVSSTPTPRALPDPGPPPARHEVQEGTAAINMPFNPPGGGPAAAPGGFTFTNSPVLDAILTTAIGLAAVFVGGILYVKWYKKNVLDKMEDAFAGGYDPALELAKLHNNQNPASIIGDSQVIRKEQPMIDSIMFGEEPGHYYMLLGPKGAGKGTMIFRSMAEVDAEGISLCEAHPDMEVFRLRLGKALNFEFNEDTQTGLFQRRDPREGGAALDIERALNKLEKVALKCVRRRGKPLVLIINNVHFFQNNEEGQHALLQLQQKAEAWAASGILTMVFTSDDFWPFHVLRKNASRMHVVSVTDLNRRDSIQATKQIRHIAKLNPVEPEVMEEAISIVGGRLAFLNKVSKSKDPLWTAKHLLNVEKGWLLSQIGLIPDCDDDVMDEQKWSSCSWLLLEAFVKLRKEQEEEHVAAGGSLDDDLPLPKLSWYQARQIMTRADFMEELDRLNVISIDINHDVRPDSNLTLHVAREVTEEDGFDKLLQGVRDRIDEIESLHRTRELTFKDLGKGDMVRLAVDKRGEELLETISDDD